MMMILLLEGLSVSNDSAMTWDQNGTVIRDEIRNEILDFMASLKPSVEKVFGNGLNKVGC